MTQLESLPIQQKNIHETKRHLPLRKNVMTKLDSILKSRDITLPRKVCLVKVMVYWVPDQPVSAPAGAFHHPAALRERGHGRSRGRPPAVQDRPGLNRIRNADALRDGEELGVSQRHGKGIRRVEGHLVRLDV